MSKNCLFQRQNAIYWNTKLTTHPGQQEKPTKTNILIYIVEKETKKKYSFLMNAIRFYRIMVKYFTNKNNSMDSAYHAKKEKISVYHKTIVNTKLITKLFK